MYIYLFEESDGYYSRILLHKEKFSSDELESMCEEIEVEIPLTIDKKCDWLIENKSFEKVSYTQINLHGFEAVERS